MAARVITTSNLQAILIGLGNDTAKVNAILDAVLNPPVAAGALKIGNPQHNNSPAIQAAQNAAKNVVDVALPLAATVLSTAVPAIAPLVQAAEKAALPSAEDIAGHVVGGLAPLFDRLISAVSKA